ncbi:MAG TPA: SDR family oxidoreductase [Casimicrobiaceae bacterium]|nr:SDR family oxidoreductase [Casimicrobiaceae bacterium]
MASLFPEPRPLLLVFGASGYIGTNLVAALIADGARIRAAARNRGVLVARDWKDVELVEADALVPDSLPAALRGVDTAYYLVHSMASGKRFGELDLTAAGHFADAAAHAGVRRIVYLGGLAPPDADSEHLVSRKQTGDQLRAGSVPVIEIRAGIIVGPGSAAYEVIRDLVYHLPLMVTPRWVSSKSSPIALSNLIEYLLRVPCLPEAAGEVYDAAGPEYLSYEQLMRQFGEVVGKRPRILPVPVLSPGLSSYWLALITSVPASIAGALIQGLKHDVPADDTALRALVPQRLLTFKEAVVAALEAERRQAVAARWTEGAFALRRFRHDYAFYAKRASGRAEATASPTAVWDVVTSLGGKTRYFYLNWIWTLRELMDWLVGGPGLTRGRRDAGDLRLGDTIDYWTVVGLDPGRRLTLDFGLKAPGAGILEFEVERLRTERTRVTVTAYWHPQGVWGLLYWAVLAPFHLFIFKGMTRAIARRAEVLETSNAGLTNT